MGFIFDIPSIKTLRSDGTPKFLRRGYFCGWCVSGTLFRETQYFPAWFWDAKVFDSRIYTQNLPRYTGNVLRDRLKLFRIQIVIIRSRVLPKIFYTFDSGTFSPIDRLSRMLPKIIWSWLCLGIDIFAPGPLKGSYWSEAFRMLSLTIKEYVKEEHNQLSLWHLLLVYICITVLKLLCEEFERKIIFVKLNANAQIKKSGFCC